jgi:hypothetical protein
MIMTTNFITARHHTFLWPAVSMKEGSFTSVPSQNLLASSVRIGFMIAPSDFIRQAIQLRLMIRFAG